jgi:hypothetical protein
MEYIYYFVDTPQCIFHINNQCLCNDNTHCDFFSTLKRVYALRGHGIVKGLRLCDFFFTTQDILGVVLSKMDAVPNALQESHFQRAQNFIVKFLSLNKYVKFVPVSPLTGDNLLSSNCFAYPWYKGATTAG